MKPLRVLLIEDNKGDALLIEDMLNLTATLKFQIISTKTLKGALQEIRKQEFDVIISDLGLPDSQGIETLQALFKQAKNIPTIVLTGNDDEQIGIEAVKSGAQDYLGKWTITSDQLLRSIRYAFHRKKVEEQLLESEEKFRIVLENIQLIGLMLDKDGKILFANDYLLKTTGWKKEEIIGKEWIKHFLPDSRKSEVKSLFDQLFTQKEYPTTFENEIICKKGQVINVSWSNMVHYDNKGIAISVTSIGENITEKIHTRKELLKNEKRYRSIVEDQTQAIVRYLPDGVITFVNDSYCNMMRNNRENLIGSNFFGFIAIDSREEIKNKIKSLTLDEPVCNEVHKITHEDGSIGWQQWTDRAIFDEHGEIYEFQAEGIEITDWKLAEESLEKSEEKFRTMVEASPDAVTTCNLDGKIIYASKRAATIFGYVDSSKMINKDFLSFVAPESKSKASNVFEKVIEKGSIMDVNHVMVMKDGSRFYGELSVTVITSEAGAPEGLIVITKDISDRKNAENAIVSYQQNLRTMASEINFAEEKERRKIACDLHDDLGQSLAMSRIKISSLKSQDVSDKVMEDLQEMEKHITHAIRSSRSLTYELSPPVLYEFGLTAGINWKLEQIAQKHNLKSKMEIAEEIPDLSEDLLILLFRTVSELLNNVIKHAQAKSVNVYVSMDGRCLNIIVEDDGKGFYTEAIEKGERKASGIGLFSLKERLEYFGGILNIDSQIGKGAKIYISVPLNI